MRRPITRRAILRNVTEALVAAQADLAADSAPSDLTRGYVTGLRVAFLLAGGQTDGREESWSKVSAEPRRVLWTLNSRRL